MLQDQGAMKVSTDMSSPHVILLGSQSRPSGTRHQLLSYPNLFGEMLGGIFVTRLQRRWTPQSQAHLCSAATEAATHSELKQ